MSEEGKGHLQKQGCFWGAFKHTTLTDRFHVLSLKLFASWHMWPKWPEKSESRVLYILRIFLFSDAEVGSEPPQSW